MSLSLLQVGHVVRFDTLAPTELGATLTDMRLASILDYDTANAIDPMLLKYSKLRSIILAGFPTAVVPTDPTQSLYYRFKSVRDPSMSVILSQHWIKVSSIQLLQATQINVSMVLSSVGDIAAIEHLLAAAYPTVQSFTIAPNT